MVSGVGGVVLCAFVGILFDVVGVVSLEDMSGGNGGVENICRFGDGCGVADPWDVGDMIGDGT